jgi:hypothetical protein
MDGDRTMRTIVTFVVVVFLVMVVGMICFVVTMEKPNGANPPSIPIHVFI